MPLLQVRDFPDDLYEKLSRVAKKQNRSVAQETIVQLKKALDFKDNRKEKRVQLLDELKNNPIQVTGNLPDPAELIREDRDR